MTPTLAFILLLLAFVAWVLLPFIPAIMELARPRDAAPLHGVGLDAGDLTWFADSFRRYALSAGLLDELQARYGMPTSQLSDPADPPRIDATGSFQLRDRTNVRVVRTMSTARNIGAMPGRPIVGDRMPEDLRDIVVVDVDAQLPEQLVVDHEVLARSNFIGGAGMRMRALLATRDADLAVDTIVLRWVHADGTLMVGRGSALYGRATSNTEMRLAADVRFERVKAPRIIVGYEDDEFVPPPTPDMLPGEPWARPLSDRITRMSPDTWRVHGDLTVPAGTIVPGNLVVMGTLVLEEGSQLHGSAKAHEGMQLTGANIITGSLTSRRDVYIGERGRVTGPVIAEGTIHVGAHAIIGTPMMQTTVTAPTVRLATGVTAYGVIAARQLGTTVQA